MTATIDPSLIQGNIKIPASKSAMQRACALALLNNGETIIQNPGNSNDDIVAINIIAALGAEAHFENENLIIRSSGNPRPVPVINCGESGLSFRMFAAIAALSNSTVLLTGTGSLLKRPMHFIDEVFPLLHVKTTSNNGLLPISVSGPLLPSGITIDASSGSQWLTGLLFAFANAATKRVTINVKDLTSKPYIDLSMQLLTHFGYKVQHEDYSIFYIDPVEKKEKNVSYYTEGDWSSASFLLVAGAIAGSITLEGLEIGSVQADKAIIDILHNCNADIKITGNLVSVNNKNELKSFEFDATDCPDLFPPLTVLAAFCKGTSVIKGTSRLVAKESDRARALVDVFTKMGVNIILKNDELHVTGNGNITASVVSTHHDHRIAMACAIAGLRSNGPIVIHAAEAVNKSYTAFYDHLIMLGASVSLSG